MSQQGPSFFTGFWGRFHGPVKSKMTNFTVISQANSSFSRAFHGLIFKFHGGFIKTNTNRAARTLQSRTSSDARMHAGLRPTRAVLLGLIIACYRIKCFPLILLIGTIEIRERLYVTWAHAGNWSSKWMISEIWLRFDNLGTENRDFTRKKCISRVDCCFHRIGPKHPTLRAYDTVKKEGPYVPEPNYN